jgi:2'-5' RNA ligase
MAEQGRLFVAVWPPSEVVAGIAAFPRPEAAGVRWTDREQWHVTLRFLGQTDIALAARAFGSIVAAPATATIGPTSERFGHRVLHFPVGGLERLAHVTAAATSNVGSRPDDRPFRGHLTLARSQGTGVDLRPFCGWPLAASWSVSELTLVRSFTRSTGARYEVLERRRLEE